MRQEFSRALAAAQTVPLKDWGRKLVARARKRAASEDISLQAALLAERAQPATALALSTTFERVGGEGTAAWVEDESHLRREDLAEQQRAAEAIEELPQRQRVAVAGPMGLLRRNGRAVPDAQLARMLGCSVADVREAREAGLAALRAVLGQEPQCPLLGLSARGYVARAGITSGPESTLSTAQSWDRATLSPNVPLQRLASVPTFAPPSARAAPLCLPRGEASVFSQGTSARPPAAAGRSTARPALACSRPARWVGSLLGGLLYA